MLSDIKHTLVFSYLQNENASEFTNDTYVYTVSEYASIGTYNGNVKGLDDHRKEAMDLIDLSGCYSPVENPVVSVLSTFLALTLTLTN